MKHLECGFKNYDELVFGNNQTDISPFSEETWDLIISWYWKIAGILGGPILIATIILAWKMIIASLVVFFVVSLIRSVWYMFKAASALQRDLPMSDREHDIGKTLNYVRAVVGCIVAWIGMIVATYIIITKLIPKIISLYLAGNVIVWGITISLITFASILTLAVLFHEKNRKIEKLLEILLIAVFLLFMVFLLVGCIETVSIVE